MGAQEGGGLPGMVVRGDLEQPPGALAHVRVRVAGEAQGAVEDGARGQFVDLAADPAVDELDHGDVGRAPRPRRGGAEPVAGGGDELRVAQKEPVARLETEVVALRPVGDVRLQPVAEAVEEPGVEVPPGDLVERGEAEQDLLVVDRPREQRLRDLQAGRGREGVLGEVAVREGRHVGVAHAERRDGVREVPLDGVREPRRGEPRQRGPEFPGGVGRCPGRPAGRAGCGHGWVAWAPPEDSQPATASARYAV